MPFDLVYEFLTFPITNAEFYEGKTFQDRSKPYFSYVDTLATTEKLNENDKLLASLKRVERNGIRNELIANWINQTKIDIEYNKLNTAVNLFNESITLYNNYIGYKNQQFKPLKTDNDIKYLLDNTETKFNESKNLLADVKIASPEMEKNIRSFYENMNKVKQDIYRERNFLNTYLATSKQNRMRLFYK